MSPEQENFEAVRRLLSLKRYEQPPPGYFNDFSARVLAGIEARREEQAAWLPARWLASLWQAFETKPALAGAFGMAVCGLLVSGVVYSEQGPGASGVSPLAGTDGGIASMSVAAQTPLMGDLASFSSTSGTAAGMAPANSLFDEVSKAQQRPQDFFGAHPETISFQPK